MCFYVDRVTKVHAYAYTAIKVSCEEVICCSKTTQNAETEETDGKSFGSTTLPETDRSIDECALIGPDSSA